jgi:hypothetical protein
MVSNPFVLIRITKLIFQIRMTILSLFLLLIMMTACTARIARIQDYGDYLKYTKVRTGEDLGIGVTILEKPGDANFLMNRSFKGINLFVINVKMKNLGRDTLIIKRQDIPIITKDNTKFTPLSKDSAVICATGPLGIYRTIFLQNIGYGYQAFGLDEKIILAPSEEQNGYLFYRVRSKYYEQVKEGEIHILFSRINLIENSIFRLKIGE